MQVFEKIIEKMEELKQIEINRPDNCDEDGNGDGEQIYDDGRSQGRYEQTVKIIEIVKQAAAEYNNGWIPCSEPPKVFREESRELIPFLVCDEESQYPYRAFYDGKNWGDGFSKLNPIAWQPLPEPYQPNVCNANDCPFNDGRECPAAEGCAGYEQKGE